MASVSGASISAIPIWNQLWPSQDCPKSVRLDLDFQAATEYDIDLLIQNQNGQFDGCQACYYNNQTNLAAVNLTVPDSGFQSYFRQGFQGFRPLIFSKAKTIGRFSCTGGTGVFRILLMNTPVQPLEWSAI